MKNLVIAIKLFAEDHVTKPLNVVTGNIKKSSLVMTQAYAKANNTLSAGLGRARDLSVVGETMLGVSKTLIAGLNNVVDAGKEYEAALSRLQAATNSTKPVIASLGFEARKVGPMFGYSASEAVDGLTELGKAGLNAAQSSKALPGLLSLARAGYMEVGEAATFGADAMASFGLKASDFSHISDVMVAAADASTIGVSDLAETFKYTSAVAKLVGASIEDTAAMTALLGSRGIKGSMAGTAMKQIYTQLANPKKAELLGQIGVKTVDKKGDMRSMPIILDEIAKKMETMGKKWGSGQKLAFMQAIFDTRAAPAALNLMKLGSKGIAEMTAKVNTLGIANKKAQIILGNVEGAENKFNQSVDNLKIAVFTQIAPVLMTIYNRLSKIAAKAQEWAEKHKGLVKFTVAVIAISAVLVGVTAVTLIVITTLGILKNSFLAGIIVVKGFGAALMTTPIGWILAGIALLIGAAVLIVKNWKPISGFFKGLWEKVAGAFSFIFAVINKFMNTRFGAFFMTTVMPIIGIPMLIYRNWGPISGFFKKLWAGISGFFKDWLKRLKDAFKKGTLTEMFGPIMLFPDLIIRNWDKLKKFWEGLKRTAKSLAETFLGANPVNAMRPTTIIGKAGKWIFEDISTPKATGKPVKPRTSTTYKETNNRVTVDFKNVPKGTHIDTRKAGTKVNISRGMNNGMAR